MNYFHRQIQLWGEQTQRALSDKRILIIGAGGLGSSLSYALGASGIGRISVVDFDTVAPHNIHRQFDLILDATDNLATRAQIDAFAKQIGVPWVFASVDSWQCQVCFVQNADFKFFPSLNATPAGITAAIVMFAASFEANLALRYLAGLEVEKDLLYYANFFGGELELRKIKL